MEKIPFIELPEKYLNMIHNIKDKMIQELYSNFSFLYYPMIEINENGNPLKNEDNNMSEVYLINFLKNFKLITYNLVDDILNTKNSKEMTEINSFYLFKYCYSIFCIEKQCIIVEKIDSKLIYKILENLKESTLINANIFITHDQKITVEQEEIQKFCSNFNSESKFIKQTLPPIIGYWIRRNFYPTNYFKDQSFFVYDQHEAEYDKLNIQKIENFLIDFDINKLDNIIQNLDLSNKVKNQCKNQEFEKEDFIILREIYNNENASFNLVIHRKNLKIYMMKILNNGNFEHEKTFCTNYSSRYLVPFYGFVKEKNKIIGFIYKYMCNNTLSSFIKQHENQITEMYSLNVICRIFQGIMYLHSNSLFHRDLKPANILIDNNFIPYISDFETIRHPIDEDDSSSEISNDIGSLFYMSPEQYGSGCYSYPSDIYSFGLIIYFIKEKKNMKTEKSLNESMTESYQGILMKNCSENMQNLYKNCIKFDPKERPTIEQIKLMINDEVNSFYFLQKDLVDEKLNLTNYWKNQFIYEYLFLQTGSLNKLDVCCNNIKTLQYVFSMSKKCDFSNMLIKMGNLYKVGQYVKEDFIKAKEYYKLAANKNNIYAFYYLGNYYFRLKRDFIKAKKFYKLALPLNSPFVFSGLGQIYFKCDANYAKAKSYLEKAANYFIPESLFYLGIMYLNGLGVPENYSHAHNLFKIAAKLNLPDAFFMLGEIYLKGIGVNKDFLLSKRYFELAAQYNVPGALINLGGFYLQGLGVQQDYLKAKEFYNRAAELNNSQALLILGYMYQMGLGIKKDYQMAKKYYELATSLHNIDAFCNLGSLYMLGLGVEKDCFKGKEYIEIGAKKGNLRCLFSLGTIYLFGNGVPKDDIKAKEYFKLAAKPEMAIEFYKLAEKFLKEIDVANNILTAIELYEIAANLNNLDALFRLATIYYHGVGIERNYSKAIQYLLVLSERNYIRAYNYLGIIYTNGYGVKKNYIKAKEYLEIAAKSNDHEAIFNLGELYLSGLGVKKDYIYAKKCYELAIQAKIPKAYIRLGMIYLNGSGVEKDFIKAKEYFELGGQMNNPVVIKMLKHIYDHWYIKDHEYFYAKSYYELTDQQKNAISLFNIFFLSSKGYDVHQDYISAKEYSEFSIYINKYGSVYKTDKIHFKDFILERDDYIWKEYFLLFESDVPVILFEMAINYFKGYGIKKDINRAFHFLHLSSQLNYSPALFHFGLIYYKGDITKKNDIKALQYFELSGKLNNSNALIMIGHFYEDGIVVKKDIGIAIEYYEKSGKLGNPYGYLYLGLLYRKGYKICKDIPRARKYFLQAYELKSIVALLLLGDLFFKEYQKDFCVAKHFYELAAEYNNIEAIYRLGILYYYGYGVNPNFEKARKYFEHAAQYMHPDALNKLGYIYSHGLGVTININMGIDYYNYAAKLGNTDSLFILGKLYSNGIIVDIDLPKSISYYQKCIRFRDDIIVIDESPDLVPIEDKKMNKSFYSAFNELGIIYLTAYKDITKAYEYIKEAAFAELPYGQNNLGLLYQFYMDSIEDAKYMYKRSSEHLFAPAEYNLGYLYEVMGEIEEAMKYYIRASNDENNKILFRNFNINKEIQMDTSKLFIIRLANLKLVEYYFQQEKYEESKKYFVRCINELIKKYNCFEFPFVNNLPYINECFSYFKWFILGFPDFKNYHKIFNVKSYFAFSNAEDSKSSNDKKTKEPSINDFDDNNNIKNSEISNKVKKSYDSKMKQNTKIDQNENNIFMDEFQKRLDELKKCENKEIQLRNLYILTKSVDYVILFDDPDELFDFVLFNDELKPLFIKEIKDIITQMNEILYKPPYSILFGKIDVSRRKNETNEVNNHKPKDINELFYEGFSIK